MILMFFVGDGGESQRIMREWEAQQQYGRKSDWKRPPRPPKRKSGGIISAIKALFRKRWESKNLEKKGEEKPDNSGPFIKPISK